MTVEHVNYSDTLRQGTDKINAAIDQSNEAMTEASEAKSTADEAKNLANSVQDQLNQVVIEGDSSVEAAQARVGADGYSYTTLKERLDNEHNNVLSRLEDIAINIKTLGAVGDGVTDNTNVFQQALDIANSRGRVHIYIPDGTYDVHNELRIYKNTTIELSDGAIIRRMGTDSKLFINGERDNSIYASGYNGDGNIKIIGHGTIDLCGDINPSNEGTGFLELAHADKAEVRDITIKNCYAGHFIEVNSSRNVKILGVTFDTFIPSASGEEKLEAVQIDIATHNSFPYFGEDDYTTCDNITVRDCTFINCRRGVGQHHTVIDDNNNQYFHTNIKIINNTFKNCTDIAIKPESFKNSIVEGNFIKDAGYHGIGVYACDTILLKNNVIDGASGYGIFFTDKEAQKGDGSTTGFYCRSKNITYLDNQINNVGLSGIRVQGTDIGYGSGNRVMNAVLEGYYETNTNNIRNVKNEFYGVAQDETAPHRAAYLNGMYGSEFSQNVIDNTNFSKQYDYAIQIGTSAIKNRVNNNYIAASGSLGLINDLGTLTELDGKVLITDKVSQSSGDIILKDSILNYKELWVMTGGVSAGEFVSQLVKPYNSSGFLVGNDVISCKTSSGNFVANIVSETKLTIQHTDNIFRYILGVR